MPYLLSSPHAFFLWISALFSVVSATPLCEQPPMHAKYPDTIFQSPLNRPLTLSGSFGELRGGHFHSGLDFTTYERTGLPIKAIANGYVSRIKVSATGFGKALYIRHPMGYTSVYAHLKSFRDDIAAYVKKAQYQQESYQLNLYPGEGRFSVEQGSVIAKSGNSGSSTGPHLHFEIRETRTAKPLNPLYFGFKVKDTKAPVIRGLRLYPVNGKSQLMVRFDHQKPVKTRLEPVTLQVEKTGNHYRLANVESMCARGKIGVGVAVTDYHNRSSHALGVSEITLSKGGQRVFKSRIDKFRFAETRYVNAHMDYAAHIATNAEYQRCFILPGNALPFYEAKNKGLLDFSASTDAQCKVVTADAYANKAVIKWNMDYCQKAPEDLPPANQPEPLKYLPFDKASKVRTPNLRLSFPAGAFYDTVAFHLSEKSVSSYAYSPVYQVHNRFTPVHRYYQMAMDATGVPSPLRDDALIIHLEPGSEPEPVGGSYERGFVKAKTRQFGRFTIAVDSLPPSARLVNVPKGRSYAPDRPLRVRVDDELSGLAGYTPHINGEWVRMAYDKKNNLLTFTDFERLEGQNHTLELMLKDEQGNQTTFRRTFQTP